jgi:hypothetical protein
MTAWLSQLARKSVTVAPAYDLRRSRQRPNEQAYEAGFVRGLVLGYAFGVLGMIAAWVLKILEQRGHL